MDKHLVSKKLRSGSFLCAALAACAEILSVLAFYDKAANYFDHNALLPTVAVALALLGSALGIASAILTASDALGEDIFSEKISLSPAAIGFLTAALFAVLYCTKTVRPIIGLLAALLLICGMAYGIVSSLPKLRQHKNLSVLLGMLAVLGTILLNAYYYFDVSLEMNAPFKLTTQMGLLCATLYLTGEIRFLLGAQKPRLFLAIGTTLISVGSLCSLSLLVACLLGKTDSGDYVAGSLLVFCMMLTAIIRTRSLIPREEIDQDDETVEVEE